MRNVEFLPSIIYELVVKRFPLFKLEKKSYSVFRNLMEEEKTKGYQTQSTGGMDNITYQDKFYMGKSRESNLAPPTKPIEVINLDGDTYSNFRNWKRSAEGSRALPLLNFSSLEQLVLRLFFQKRVKLAGKFVTVKADALAGPNDPFFATLVRVRIRVLMAIGPRSGLWYLDKKVTS
jgi:hypothetical protein